MLEEKQIYKKRFKWKVRWYNLLMSSVTARKSGIEKDKQRQKGIYRKTRTNSTVTLLKPSIQKVSKRECVKEGGRETMAKFSESFEVLRV